MTTAITIGNFDGVHLGHAALVRAASHVAVRSIALVFDPHPASILAPDRVPPRLSTFQQRERWLRSLGVSEVHRLEPTRDFLAQSPEAFLTTMIERYHPKFIVEGPDFCFGRNRSGTVGTLCELGPSLGFETLIVPPVEHALEDLTLVKVSSSTIRWLLSHGRVRDAARLLGRPYQLTGTVVQAEQRGRTIGFPTANLAAEQLLPADGVYAGVGILPDGCRLPAAISIGTKPTFHAQHHRTVEAHLLLNSGTTLVPGVSSEYGWPLALDLIAWLREQARFASLPVLIDQLHRDCDRVRALVPSPSPACP